MPTRFSGMSGCGCATGCWRPGAPTIMVPPACARAAWVGRRCRRRSSNGYPLRHRPCVPGLVGRRGKGEMEEFFVKTKRKFQVIDITAKVQEIVERGAVAEGLCCVFVPHATAAVAINENADPNIGEAL